MINEGTADFRLTYPFSLPGAGGTTLISVTGLMAAAATAPD